MRFFMEDTSNNRARERSHGECGKKAAGILSRDQCRSAQFIRDIHFHPQLFHKARG